MPCPADKFYLQKDKIVWADQFKIRVSNLMLQATEVLELPPHFMQEYFFVEYFDNCVVLIGDSHVTLIKMDGLVAVPRVKPLSEVPVEIQLPKLAFYQKYISIQSSIAKWEKECANQIDYTAITQQKHDQKTQTTKPVVSQQQPVILSVSDGPSSAGVT